MGLINLKTDLKSLKYGYDRPGGGSSNQPYIVTPIPDGLTANGPDFLLRQGSLRSSATDVERLTKFFADTTSVRGLLFTAKQLLLERQNPKMVNTNRIYLPTNTITQAGALASGTHFNKQGLDPLSPLSYFAGGVDGYYHATRGIGEYPTFQTLPDGTIENRLTIAYTSKILNQSLGSLNINPFGITNLNPNILSSYTGGPNAPLGLGVTNIRIQNPTIKLKDVYEYGEDKATAVSNNPNIVSALRGQNFLSHKTPTWIYDPTQQGASFQYESLDNVSPDKVYTPLFTDNISNILNRETPLPLTPNREPSTFIKNSGYLGSPDKYLIPSEVNTANIVWSYKLDQATIGRYAGVSDYYFNLYETPSDYKSILFSTGSLTRRDRIIPLKHAASNTFDHGDSVLEDNPNYLVPSNVQVNKDSWIYDPTKQGVSHEFKLIKDTNSNLLFKEDYKVDILNRKQDIRPIQTFSKQEETTSKKGTTTLASLNPQYNIAYKSSNGKIERVPRPYPNINEFNREDTYKTMPTVYRSSRTKLSNSTIKSDRLNETDIIQSTSASLDDIALPNVDLVKFFFEINNNNGNSSQNWFLYFRAYLNDLSDNFTGEWQNYKYVGRAENFYRYSGFTREMSLSFTVYAHSRAEMVPLYNKLNYLAGTTAPDYSDEGYLRGNFTYITVGDYINNMPSIIKSVSLKPSFEAGWDINRKMDGTPFSSTDGIDNVGQVPRSIEITINFTPLHKFTPQFRKSFINDIDRSGPAPQPEKEFKEPNLIDSSGGTIVPSGGNAL